MGKRKRASTRKQRNIKAAAIVVVEAKSANLPDEMIYEILLRLPVKSLTRFKAVSKSWLALISAPQFVKAHLNTYNTGDRHQRYGVIGRLNDESDENRRMYISLAPINSSEATEIKEVKYDCPFSQNSFSIEILGSCNGLLLVGVSHIGNLLAIIFWNPSTGEYKKTSLGQLINLRYYVMNFISGLGYDSRLDEYKAVITIYSIKRNWSYMFICCPKTCSWREVDVDDDDFPYQIYSSCPGVMVNKAPHWVVGHKKEDITFSCNRRRIIYFDAANERFNRVSEPESLSKNAKFDLGVLAGCLCLVHNHEESHVDVWAMKEYGIEESWTKLFVIRCSVQQFMPLGFTNNGDDVVVEIDGMKLVSYNLKTKKEKFLAPINNEHEFGVASYVESLVSPNSAAQRKTRGRMAEKSQYFLRETRARRARKSKYLLRKTRGSSAEKSMF